MIEHIHFPKHNREEYYDNHELESKLLNSIITGDAKETSLIFKEIFDKNYIYSLSSNCSLRSVKNYMISLLSIVCHTVIQKGVSPYSAKAMHNKSIQMIEDSSDIDIMYDLCESSIIGFTVQTITGVTKFKTNNLNIKKALNYIHDNLGEDITLEDVAKYVHLSKYYFCTQFKSEIGMCFSEYINFTRIEKSKFFLCHSNKSILDIAILLGFNNQAYFTSVFKKYTETTPGRFKTKNKSYY